MSHPSLKVLLVEDNPGDVGLLRIALSEATSVRFELTPVGLLENALALLATKPFDIALLDLSLPDAAGLETIHRVATEAPTVPIVVLTGLDDERIGLQAVKSGAQDYLVKGQIETHLLVRTIRYAIERKRHQQEREKLIVDLQEALARIKTLSGLLPICACCKKIRDDKGYWNQVEGYIMRYSDARFSHSFCPDCVEKLKAEYLPEPSAEGAATP